MEKWKEKDVLYGQKETGMKVVLNKVKSMDLVFKKLVIKSIMVTILMIIGKDLARIISKTEIFIEVILFLITLKDLGNFGKLMGR